MSVNDVQYSTINIISACVAKAGTQSEYVFFEGLYSLYSDGLPLQINEEINRRPPKVFPAIKKRADGARKFLNNEFTILPMPPGSGSGRSEKKERNFSPLSPSLLCDNVCAAHCFTKGRRIETVVSGEEDLSSSFLSLSSFPHDGIIPTLTPFTAQIELPNCSPSRSISSGGSRLQFPRAGGCVCEKAIALVVGTAWHGGIVAKTFLHVL